jgi:hypothetical protein
VNDHRPKPICTGASVRPRAVPADSKSMAVKIVSEILMP